MVKAAITCYFETIKTEYKCFAASTRLEIFHNVSVITLTADTEI